MEDKLAIAQLVERWTVEVNTDIHRSLVRFRFARYFCPQLCLRWDAFFARQHHDLNFDLTRTIIGSCPYIIPLTQKREKEACNLKAFYLGDSIHRISVLVATRLLHYLFQSILCQYPHALMNTI